MQVKVRRRRQCGDKVKTSFGEAEIVGDLGHGSYLVKYPSGHTHITTLGSWVIVETTERPYPFGGN